jgi:hypothetical protein
MTGLEGKLPVGSLIQTPDDVVPFGRVVFLSAETSRQASFRRSDQTDRTVKNPVDSSSEVYRYLP